MGTNKLGEGCGAKGWEGGLKSSGVHLEVYGEVKDEKFKQLGAFKNSISSQR